MFKLQSSFDLKRKSSDYVKNAVYIVETKVPKIDIPKSCEASLKNKKDISFLNDEGLVSILFLNKEKLNEDAFGYGRDFLASHISALTNGSPKTSELHFETKSLSFVSGAIVGLDLAAYRFDLAKTIELGHISIFHNGKKFNDKIKKSALEHSLAINFARHLVNLPPNELHPVSYAKLLQDTFKNSKSVKVEVYDEKRLAKEKCGLLLGVGQGASHPPRLVKLSYKGSGAKKKKVAIIGKGITFDTGGLDLKPASGMRLMKKDMGGSASVAGFFVWLQSQKIPYDIEGYLALAENAVDERATRPSDIHVARNGLKVEIDNTDAEGRLVMADALDMACDSKPDFILDFATLTGAGKVALGQDIASLFCNDDALAKKLVKASQVASDPAWRMPLYQPYAKELSSSFADMVNSSSSGFGGSITAALFLEKFVRKIPWAHFDIFAWTTSNQPAMVQKGGSGQGVSTLIEFFKT